MADISKANIDFSMTGAEAVLVIATLSTGAKILTGVRADIVLTLRQKILVQYYRVVDQQNELERKNG